MVVAGLRPGRPEAVEGQAQEGPGGGDEGDGGEQHGAHLFSRNPATRPRATSPARNRSEPMTSAQTARTTLRAGRTRKVSPKTRWNRPPRPMKDEAERLATDAVRSGPVPSRRPKKKSEPPLWQSVQPFQPRACWAGRTPWASGQVTGPAALSSRLSSRPFASSRKSRPPET
ncbi:MAG: hypothetical protein MZV64_68015 [Ignavibacteriales bacterium]|nr:hypothetical protein [Ignavibacteriales bacterium]